MLEMDSELAAVFDPPGGQISVDLAVADCKLISLSDKAFELGEREQRWDQSHLGIALKFGGARRWHCVWASLEERDDDLGECRFRSYDDVYLQPLVRQSRASRKRRNGHGLGHGQKQAVKDVDKK